MYSFCNYFFVNFIIFQSKTVLKEHKCTKSILSKLFFNCLKDINLNMGDESPSHNNHGQPDFSAHSLPSSPLFFLQWQYSGLPEFGIKQGGQQVLKEQRVMWLAAQTQEPMAEFGGAGITNFIRKVTPPFRPYI